MYRKMLVPLDGSELAECALPHVQAIATGCAVEEIILVSVTEPVVGYVHRHSYPPERQPQHPPEPDAGGPPSLYGFTPPHLDETSVVFGKMTDEARRYLSRKREALNAKGMQVTTKVVMGKPADEILSVAEDENADLIVMASHGRSGIGRWTHGSVAEKVFRSSRVPVLMIRASESEAAS